MKKSVLKEKLLPKISWYLFIGIHVYIAWLLKDSLKALVEYLVYCSLIFYFGFKYSFKRVFISLCILFCIGYISLWGLSTYLKPMNSYYREKSGIKTPEPTYLDRTYNSLASTTYILIWYVLVWLLFLCSRKRLKK